jgi:hypothetical protein
LGGRLTVTFRKKDGFCQEDAVRYPAFGDTNQDAVQEKGRPPTAGSLP